MVPFRTFVSTGFSLLLWIAGGTVSPSERGKGYTFVQSLKGFLLDLHKGWLALESGGFAQAAIRSLTLRASDL